MEKDTNLLLIGEISGNEGIYCLDCFWNDDGCCAHPILKGTGELEGVWENFRGNDEEFRCLRSEECVAAEISYNEYITKPVIEKNLNRLLVVTNQAQESIILHYAGEEIEEHFEENEVIFDELDLGIPPLNICVWEGVADDYEVVESSCSDCSYETDTLIHWEGDFRRLTDNEWKALLNNKNPWE